MDRDVFREILRSPLDDRTPIPRWRLPLLALVGGLAAGALAALPWALDGEADPAALPSSATVAAPVEAPDGLYPGYAALDTGRGLRTEWIHHTGDVVLVTVSSAVPSDQNRERARLLGTSTLLEDGSRALGRWELCLKGGRCVEASREVFDPGAEGMITLVFPAAGIVPIDTGRIERLALYPTVGAGSRLVDATYAVGALPSSRQDPGIRIPATELVDVGDGTEVARTDLSYLVVDLLEIDTDYGAVAWHFEGPDEVGPMLGAVLTLTGDTDGPALLVPAELTVNPRAGNEPMPATPAREATLPLTRASHTGTAEYPVRSIEAVWQVSWARYGVDALEVPLDHVLPGE